MTRQRGFTLIEILVVVAILGVLMGLVSVLVLRARGKSEQLNAEQLVKTFLPNYIERYKNEFKRLPPMNIKELNGIKRWKNLNINENTTNEAAEVLLVALKHPDFASPLGEGDLPVESPFGNTDDDIWNQVPEGSDKVEAMEIIDPWGTPIVYIHKNAYGTPVIIINSEGEEMEVTAVKKPDGATFYNPSSYQIICLGRNGRQDEPDDVSNDDIMNFTLDEDE